MILASSSLSRPGLTSTWTPRSLRIATAAGESLSEIRTRGVMKLVRNGGHDSRESDRESRLSVSCRESGHPAQGQRRRLWTPAFAGVTKSESGSLGELALLEHERVIEPVRQRLDIGRFDRRAAPDAQASRRVAISAGVKRDLFFLKHGRQTLGECGLASAVRAATAGSTTLRQTLVFERVSVARARKSIQCVRSTQSAIALALASARAKSAFRPPSDFAQFRASR